MGNVEVVQNDDGTVDYNLTMRDDIKFSDGTPADIDDVIFGIYVLADPTYDGAATIYAQPIEGIQEYYHSQAYKYNLILEAGRDGSSEFFTADEGAAYWAAYDEQLGDKAEDYKALVATSSVDSISGVIRTGDYSLTIHMTEFDATSIYNMSFTVVPLHYYGDEAQYDYEAHKFGFPKGDLSIVREKTTQPLGCGPYVFDSYANGVVTLKANPYYFEGAPVTETLLMQEAVDSDYVPGIITGTFDVAGPSLSNDTVAAIQDGNSNGELTGDTVTTYLVDYRGYGYLGINADLVNVGGAENAGTEESKALRKAFMTVMAVYRDTVINSYYGDRASVIQYPISNTSWAAPRPTDEGYQNCYSKDADGNDLYSEGMSDEQKYEAALQGAISFFKAAGYTALQSLLLRRLPPSASRCRSTTLALLSGTTLLRATPLRCGSLHGSPLRIPICIRSITPETHTARTPTPTTIRSTTLTLMSSSSLHVRALIPTSVRRPTSPLWKSSLTGAASCRCIRERTATPLPPSVSTMTPCPRI